MANWQCWRGPLWHSSELWKCWRCTVDIAGSSLCVWFKTFL